MESLRFERRQHDRWPITGVATAWRLGGPRFGETATLKLLDYSTGGVGALSDQPIEPGAVVLVHTGWGRYYPDARLYLGSDRRGAAVDLSFPGLGAAAARILVERRVDMVGLDTASLDHGPSTSFEAHRVLCEADIPGLENVANLHLLPPRGATVVALPMKIDRGSGGPCRIIAILP